MFNLSAGLVNTFHRRALQFHWNSIELKRPFYIKKNKPSIIGWIPAMLWIASKQLLKIIIHKYGQIWKRMVWSGEYYKFILNIKTTHNSSQIWNNHIMTWIRFNEYVCLYVWIVIPNRNISYTYIRTYHCNESSPVAWKTVTATVHKCKKH